MTHHLGTVVGHHGAMVLLLNACDSARRPIVQGEQSPDHTQTLATYLQEPAEGLAASFLLQS